MLDEKIQDKRDDLLRAMLLNVLEEEAARDQTRAVLAVVRRHLEHLGRVASAADAENASSNSRPEAMDVDDHSTADAGADGDGHEAKRENVEMRAGDESEQLRCSYRLLLERLESAPQSRDAVATQQVR